MKVLFVCHGNVGRSQAAMEYFKQLSSEKTDSAGTDPDTSGKTIGEMEGARSIVKSLQEEGIDISSNLPKLVTENMALNFDKVVCMANPEDTPAWLLDSPNYVYWKVADFRDLSLEAVRKPRDQIRQLVQDLIASENSVAA